MMSHLREELSLNKLSHLATIVVFFFIFLAIPVTVLTVLKTDQNTRTKAASYTPGQVPGCQFQKADPGLNVAFCDTFDAPAGTGNRSGDLNGLVWGVSRATADVNSGQGVADKWYPVNLQKCGTTVTVFPPKDVAICNGKFVEGVDDGGNFPDNDGGQQTVLAAYPKQPFDIANRTGTATFDVSADSNGIHQAWPTFVYTDLPVPAPYSQASGIATNAQNSFGFTLAHTCGAGSPCGSNCSAGANGTTVDEMFVTRNYGLSYPSFNRLGCVAKGNLNSLNHFEVRISTSQVQVWASDPGSTSLKEIAELDNANLPLTRGLIWMEDNHYNACKDIGSGPGTQCDHTFAWDNVGFDGPVLPRDLANDVLDNTASDGSGVDLGWFAPKAVTVNNISNIAQAAKAIVTFNWYPRQSTVPSVRVNGNAWHTTAWPAYTNDNNHINYVQRTIAVPIPLSEIVNGTNTIEFQSTEGSPFSNVNLILVGAGGVPTCLDPSNCSLLGGDSTNPGDTTKPTVNLTSPTSGATVSGNSNLIASASDNVAVTSVGFYVDNIFVGTGNQTSSNYTLTWDSTKVANGTHTIVAKAFDAAGNEGDSSVITVTTSNTTPPPPAAVKITSPLSGATVSGTASIFSQNTDGTSNGSVSYFLDGTTNVIGTDSFSPYSISWNTTTVANGNHTITVRRTDISSTDATVTYNVQNTAAADLTPPTVSITSPSNGEVISGSTQVVSVTAADNVALANVSLTANGIAVGSVLTSSPYNFTWNVPSTNGSYTLSAKATDTSGNTNFSTITVSVNHGDTTAPTAPTNLTATASSTPSVILNWTASTDNVAVAKYWIVRNNQTIASTTTNSFTDTTVSPSTLYTYQVIASDAAANNSSPSNTASVTTPALVDKTAPSAPTALVGSAVSANQINLSWTRATDNVGVVGYDVYRNSTKVASVSSTSFGDTGLLAATTYTYYVVARDSAGNLSQGSNIVSVTTQTPVVNLGNLTGKVSSTLGSGIAFAHVALALQGATSTYTADSSGVYLLSNIAAGSYSLTYSASGYASLTLVATITAGTTTTKNVILKPVTTLSTLGTRTVGSLVDGGSHNYINGSRFKMGAASGVVSSMSVNVGPVESYPTNQYQLAIYTDNAGKPGSLVARSSSGSLVANTWNTLPLSASLNANSSYWLVFNTNASSGSFNNMRYFAGGTSMWSSSQVSFGTWPSSFSATGWNNNTFSIYASYR